MRVLHATALAQRQAFASRLQFFLALVMLFARLQTFGRCLVRRCHGAVARNVFLRFFRAVLGHSRERQAERQDQKTQTVHIHPPISGVQIVPRVGKSNGVDRHHGHARTKRAKVFLNFSTLGAATAMQ